MEYLAAYLLKNNPQQPEHVRITEELELAQKLAAEAEERENKLKSEEEAKAEAKQQEERQQKRMKNLPDGVKEETEVKRESTGKKKKKHNNKHPVPSR